MLHLFINKLYLLYKIIHEMCITYVHNVSNYCHYTEAIYYCFLKSHNSNTIYLPFYIVNKNKDYFNYIINNNLTVVPVYNIIKYHELFMTNKLKLYLYSDENFSMNKYFIKNNTESKSIYVTRKKSLRRHIVNEEELIINLKKNIQDIVILDLDETILTPLEQAFLFSTCRLFITQHGASLINMIYISKNSKVIEICVKEDYEFNKLASKCGLEHNYIFCKNYIPSEKCIRFPRDSYITISNDEIATIIDLI